VTADSTAIRFTGVTVHYGGTAALRDFSLSVDRGETVALLGPSGSGKSTALKTLAGFERPSAGRVALFGRDVTDEPPYRRGIGLVVQQYALFPHLRVADNVAFGLRARRTPRAEVRQAVGEALAMVGMTAFARRYPGQLSGGQQQRVAIARALAIRPGVLLLDEPLSALDAKLRQDMLGELQRLRADLPDVAILHVTHDQEEALSLADRIVVLRDGRIVDTGPARELYQSPPSEFTASFLGDANLLPARVTGDGLVRVGPVTVHCGTAGAAAGSDIALCLRPHELALGPGWPGRLVAARWRGASCRLSVQTEEGFPLELDVSTREPLPAVGEPVSVRPLDNAGVLIAPGAVSEVASGAGSGAESGAVGERV
jgi:2-aminoethylphosphonate transport system ATP-binding protein